MFSTKIVAFFGLVAAVAVHAQSTAGISQCILGCTTAAATANGCSSITDVQCICTNTAFQQASAACLQANCTAEDLQSAQALQQQQCASLSGGASSSVPSGSASLSTSGSSPAGTSTAPHTSSTSSGSGSSTNATHSSSASTAAKTSGAMGLVESYGVSMATILGLGCAIAGTLL